MCGPVDNGAVEVHPELLFEEAELGSTAILVLEELLRRDAGGNWEETVTQQSAERDIPSHQLT